MKKKDLRKLSLVTAVLVFSWILTEGINGNLPKIATYNDERLLKDEETKISQ